MRLNLLLFPVLLILCVHFNSATLFSLLGKKNYILAKPRIIIKPKIYIGTGHMLHKKKALAAKTIAIGGVVGILKKLKPKISLPKIELPKIGFPKIPLSFSVSLDKPDHSSSDHEEEVEEAAEAAADAVRNAAEEGDDGHLGESKTKSHLLSSHGLHGAPSWLSEPPPGFTPFGEGYSVEESKNFRDRVKSMRSSKPRSSDQRKERNNQDDQYSRYEKEKPSQGPKRRRRPGKMEEDEDDDDDEER